MKRSAKLPLSLKRLWLAIVTKWKGGIAAHLRISHYSLVSEAQSGRCYDFTYRAQLTNRGRQALPGVIATLVPKPALTIADGQLSFGETGAGCTVNSQDTFTLRRSSPNPYTPASLEASLKWKFELNTAPIADAGPDQTVQVGQRVVLDGSGSSDADGDPVSYRWTLLSRPHGSQAALTGAGTVQASLVPDVAGEYRVQLVAHDGKVASDTDIALVTVAVAQNRDPQITSTPITSATQDSPYSYDVEATDPDGDTLSFVLTLPPAGMIIDEVSGLITWMPVQPGDFQVTVTATDGRGGSASQSYTVMVAPALVVVPNVVGLARSAAESAITAANLVVGTLTGQHSDTVPAEQVISQDPASGTQVTQGTAVNLLTSLGRQGAGLPPDPATVAPPLDPTVVTLVSDATKFLYTGSNPIQTGVAQTTIEPHRAAVLRGRVRDRNNQALSGASITVLNHPEFGQTLSRADGIFDLAVNGGGLLTLDYQKAGYLKVQRQVTVPWQDYVPLSDVIMILLDAAVTVIDLTGPDMQIARGNAVSDADGMRQATLLFPAGTEAELVFADGSTRPITSLNVRATEFTVGGTGPQAMPAELPPTSAYTYAVELSADEALAVGATEVRFNQPVPVYLENFLGFPVGMNVPLGYYDRVQGRWIGSPDGRVVEMLAVNAGLAELDTSGDGQPDNGGALGITEAERARLATLYSPGQTLWRSPMPHFTPWDCNWPFGPPPDAVPPAPPPPEPGDRPDDSPCEQPGSIIECQNQILGERIGLVGSALNLNYRSDRALGRRAANTITIPLSGDSVPASLTRIELEIRIGGRSFMQTFSATPNQSHVFEWDGLDAYGRPLQGGRTLTIRIGYVYDSSYGRPRQTLAMASFGLPPEVSIIGNRARLEITIWLEQTRQIGSLRLYPGQGLGGWSLSVHHAYDPGGQVLYLGDGNRRTVAGSGKDIILTVAGNGQGNLGGIGDGGSAVEAQVPNPCGIDIAADGSLYIASPTDHRVRRVGPDGVITTSAGTGQSGFNGDGIPATQARLGSPQDVAVGPDGSLYIVEHGGGRVRRVGSDGIITTVAGNGSSQSSGDGGPATEAGLGSPFSIDVAADGSLYITEFSERVRRVGPDGIITTAIGNGRAGFTGDGGPATSAQVSKPSGVEAAPDGSLYLADTFNQRIRRIGLDGVITTVAGNGSAGFSNDGGLALLARLRDPRDVVLGPGGNLYIADECNHVIRRVSPEGIITTVAGDGIIRPNLPACTNEFAGEGAPATQAKLNAPYDLAFGPDGDLYIADFLNHRVRRVTSALPRLRFGELLIASENGAHLFRFDAAGRHLDTRNTLTGSVLFQFGYDSAGRLIAVSDGDGNVTTIERNANGKPTAIVAPLGQRTTFGLDTNSYLTSATNPAGEVTRFGYTADGLLTSFIDARGGVRRYTYDAIGRLIRSEDPVGGFVTLARTTTAAAFQVAKTDALGRVTTFLVERLPIGGERHSISSPNGLQTETIIGADGTQTVTYSEGTTTVSRSGPDPRWGMQAPIDASQSIRTPGNLNYTSTVSRMVTLTDPNDPLSLTTLTDTLGVNGRTYTRVYNAATRTLTSTSPAGRQISTLLDNAGRVLSLDVPGVVPRRLAYDSRGCLEVITQGSGADARSFTFNYDAQGYAESTTDPLLHTVVLERDPNGRITTATLQDGRQLRFRYDGDGNLIAFTPPARPAHLFTYTPVGFVESYVAPDAGSGASVTRYAYNADHSLARVTRPDGTPVDYSYDGAGRLSSVALPRGQIRYSYDPATGMLAVVAAPDGGTLTIGYNGSIPTVSTWSGTVAGTIRRTYNSDLRLTSRTVNGAQPITFQYDRDGLLRQAGDLTISRDAANGFIAGTMLGNTADTWAYDGFGEPIGYRAISAGIEVFATQYTRDKLGRITAKTEAIGGVTSTQAYAYDTSGRLAAVTIDGVRARDYTYDSNGNRLSISSSGGVITGSYDAQDRLTRYGATTHTYTANGELITKIENGRVTNYQHDSLGNLVMVTLPDGTRIDYVADGQNHRIGKRVNGALVQGFLIQGRSTVIAELDGNNTVVSRFVYGPRANVPAYMVKSGATYRIISDHLGSPRLVIDVAAGAIAQRMDYDEFGNAILDTAPGFQPFGFAGCIYDIHTRLARFGPRDYDAETGRWTSKELGGFAGGDPNLYVYARSDPVNLADPNGLLPVAPLGGGITGAGPAGLTVIEGGAGAAAGGGAAAAVVVAVVAVVATAAVAVGIGLIINHFAGDAIQDGCDLIFGDPTKPDPKKNPSKDPRPDVFPPDPDEITRPNEPLTDPDKTWPTIDPSELPTDPNLPSPWDPKEDEDPTQPIRLPTKEPSKSPGKKPCP